MLKEVTHTKKFTRTKITLVRYGKLSTTSFPQKSERLKSTVKTLKRLPSVGSKAAEDASRSAAFNNMDISTSRLSPIPSGSSSEEIFNKSRAQKYNALSHQ
jgi:radical SAM superfamily enzyme with C-terminal helix-hairpin-helix motif